MAHAAAITHAGGGHRADRTAGLIKCPRIIGRPGHRNRTTNEHELYNPWRTVEHAIQYGAYALGHWAGLGTFGMHEHADSHVGFYGPSVTLREYFIGITATVCKCAHK